MPLLSRMVGAPLAVEIYPGAVAGLAPLLAEGRISGGGHVAVAVGPGLGEELAEVVRPRMANAEIWPVEGGTVRAARGLADRLRGGFFDAVVAIGGGKTLDTAKLAATLTGLPMVAVATSLAHDGIASPVASLDDDGGRKASFGAQMPVAVMVDLDYVRRSKPAMRRAGIGDVVSNLQAIADWRLSAMRGERVDGLAVTFAQTAALAMLHRTDSIDDEPFLEALADALVLSGVAMAAAGSSRPCSGADHEIVHAIDHLFPGTAHHGELAGMAALFCAHLREDTELFAALATCLARHGLPLTPDGLGLTEAQFAEAVLAAPATRPDRFTILEQLDLSAREVSLRVRAFVEAVDS